MAHLTLLDQAVLGPAVAALREALRERLVAVVLFGSRARRQATAESDWDLLVLAEGLPEKAFDRLLYLKRLLPTECRGAISALAKTPREFEAHLSSLYLDIALDGQVLYDPLGYAAERLGSLRALLDEVGLYRERTEAGDSWRWKNPPSGPWTLDWKKSPR